MVLPPGIAFIEHSGNVDLDIPAFKDIQEYRQFLRTELEECAAVLDTTYQHLRETNDEAQRAIAVAYEYSRRAPAQLIELNNLENEADPSADH